MTPEDKNNSIPEWVHQQRERDQRWIRENIDMLWDSASTAYGLSGRGALIVDATQWLPQDLPPSYVVFSYIRQTHLTKFEDIARLMAEYDPSKEFVIALMKASDRWSSYRVQVQERPGLLDAEMRARLPALYSGEALGLEALALVKFFAPDSGWTWYGSEFDGNDLFFGLVAGFEVELGYFSLHELETARGSKGFLVERDEHFEPKSFRDLQELHRRLDTT
jgi:hypothetical protein